ncbi:Collagen alpha-6(VI) chain, partial [Ophiophagus hannah]
MINNLPIGPNKYRLALVQYSDDIHVEFQLDDFRGKNPMLNHVKKTFSFRGGSLRTGNAIQKIHKTIFKALRRDRHQVLIIITSGVSQDDVEGPATLMREDGVKIIALGMLSASEQELKSMATHPFSYHFDTLKDLQKFSSNILSVIESAVAIYENLVISTATPPSTTYAHSMPIKVADCSDDLIADVVFVVDEAVPPTNSEYIVSFLQNTTTSLDVQKSCIRIGLVTYSNEPRVLSQLNTETEIKDLIFKIKSFSPREGEAKLGAALNFTREIIFTESAGSRRKEGVEQIATLITHRPSEDSVTEASSLLLQKGVTVFAISIEGANITQLGGVVSYPPNRNIIKVDHFSNLADKSKIFEKKLFKHIHMYFAEAERTEEFRSACEKMKADVMFLVDSSGSIRHQDFEKMKKFMQELVDKCSVGLDEVQFGVVQFSSTNKEEFQLNSSKDYIINAIGNMAQMQQNTYTGKALQFVSDYFKPAKRARPSVNKILILLTDGEAHDNVREPASALRKEGVIIYSIGITGANVTQLVEISGTPNNMFYLKDYDVLKYIEKDIMFRICSPYKLDECKRINRLDLVFVIDSSSSIGETNYILMSNFIIGIVNKSDVGKEHVQFGAVKYSNNPEIMFKLNTYSKRSDIIKFIQDNTLLKGDTYTAKALQLSKSLLTKENGSRIHQGVPQVLMVITDGESHDRAILDSTSNELRKKGTIIYAIGIKDANREELEIMAGSKDYWFYMPSFEGLEDITTNLSNQLCIDSRPECDIEAELVILADSRSIPDKELKGVKDFVINLLKSIINKDNILVGMAQFSNTLQEVFQLGSYQNLPELYSKITNMSLITGGSTLIGRALREVKTFFKTSKQRVARSVNQKLLIFTDGKSDDEFPQAAKNLRDEGVEIHAIAVGNVTDSKLLQITNSPSRKYKVDHYSDLKTLVNHVNKEICKETTEAITELRNIVVNRPSHLNTDFLDAIWNLVKNVTDIENRNTVLLLFSDGLDDNIIALGQKSEELRIQGLDGLITVALEGAKYIDQLQHIEFGKGFGYNTQLSIDTENVAMRLFQYMGTTGFEGHPGYPGDDGDPGPRGTSGIQGKQGDIGECGIRGQKGEDGADGVDGIHGEEGNTGPKGPPGDLGPKGFQGDN